MKPVAVITARAGSIRVPQKNMLPLEGRPLAEWSILHAISHGLDTIVSSDIPELLTIALGHGAKIIERPGNLATSDCSHAETISHALKTHGMDDRHCLLLQPTSPFRGDNIISKCLETSDLYPNSTILTSRSVHRFVIGGENTGSELLWDGCAAIYPPNKVGDYSNCISVPNSHTNSLQIDSEEDYIQACLLSSRIREVTNPLIHTDSEACTAAIKNIGVSGCVTLVSRDDGHPIPQEFPVAWLNHCQGWDGGRADVLFIIANPHIRNYGISQATKEVAAKARLVIVRDNGEGEWLRQQLPIICGKYILIRSISEPIGNHLTTGAMASHILHSAGCQVLRVGFSGACARGIESLGHFNYKGASREVALLHISGKDRIK